MYTSVSLRNFKSFSDANAPDLRLVNLIVGDNGSGKTAFLEGIFVASGVTPELILRTRNWRGWGDNTAYSGSREDLERALWGDLFHQFEVNKPAVIALRGSGDEDRSVTISYRKPGRKQVIPPDRRQRQKSPLVVPDPERISFKWEVHGRPPINISAQVTKDGIVFTPESDAFVRVSFFSSSRNSPPSEVATRFTRLDQSFAVGRFEEIFRQHYPHIRELSLNVNLGVPLLSARVGSIPEKVPLVGASGGVSKLASYMLAIADNEGGHILIDEIENGFYYRRLPGVLRTLYEYAKQYDCQLFLSTHSEECLRACAEIAEEVPDDFCLLQTEIGEAGSTITRFGGDDFASAVTHGVEVR